jgi:chromosome segregation ATPase
MPNNKLPRMEIETRVAQLRQTIESVSRRIAGQHADVATLRQRLQDLVRGPRTDTQSLPERERNQALTEIAEGLGAQLRELQDAITRMQHAGAELRACLAAIEHEAAGTGAPREAGEVTGDAAVQALQARLDGLQAEFERLRDAGARRDQELLGGVAAMRERATAMDQQLRQLIEAQEGLELQLALLSKEAEQALPPSAPQGASAEPARLAQRLDAIEQRLPVGEATAAPLQPDLVERLAGLERRTEHLGDQVATQASDRQTLQETIDGLGEQQLRRDNEVRTLERRLRQRSLFALLLLLLGAALLVFALYRGLLPREAARQATQPAVATDASTALRQELDGLRSETEHLGTALAELSRRVDALTTAPRPAELAAQIERLDATLNGLAEEGLQLRRRGDLLEEEQARLRRELDAVVVEIEALRQAGPPAPAGAADGEPAAAAAPAGPPQPAGAPPASTAAADAGTSATSDSVPGAAPTVQQPPNSPSDAAAAESGPAAAQAPAHDVPATRASSADATEAVTDAPQRRWEQARAQRRFTLQLIGVHEREHLAWFLKRHRLDAETAVHHTRYQGRPWLVLLYGIYDSQRQAMAAARRLPPDLAALRPWVRQIPSQGRLEPL